MARLQWTHHESHEPELAVHAGTLTTSEIVRLPLLENKLQPLSSSSLGHITHQRRISQVAGQKSPNILQQVHTVRKCCVARRVIHKD